MEFRKNLFRLLAVILFVLCITCSDAEVERNETYIDPFDIEQVKQILFNANVAQHFNNENSSLNNKKCLTELKTIGNGLINKEKWAKKRK